MTRTNKFLVGCWTALGVAWLLATPSGQNLLTTIQPVSQNGAWTITANQGTPTNWAMNEAQIAGTARSVNSGTLDAGTARDVLATNSPAIATWGHGATGAAPPANGTMIVGLGSGATGGLLTAVTVCDSDFDIDINTATTTLAITGVSGRKVRVCSFNMVATATDTVAWIEGTGATCGTGTAGMIGTATAAHGQAFAANGGIAIGSGFGEVLTTATAGDSVCLVTSAATQLDGHIKYAIY